MCGTRKKKKNRTFIISDNENERSISLEKEDFSDKKNGEVEDAEDFNDAVYLDENEVELKRLIKYIKKLKKRMEKK
jgi:hypothetical protein